MNRIKVVERTAALPRTPAAEVPRAPVPPADASAVTECLRALLAAGVSGAELDEAFNQLPVGTLELFRSRDGWDRIGLTVEELVTLATRLSEDEDWDVD